MKLTDVSAPISIWKASPASTRGEKRVVKSPPDSWHGASGAFINRREAAPHTTDVIEDDFSTKTTYGFDIARKNSGSSEAEASTGRTKHDDDVSPSNVETRAAHRPSFATFPREIISLLNHHSNHALEKDRPFDKGMASLALVFPKDIEDPDLKATSLVAQICVDAERYLSAPDSPKAAKQALDKFLTFDLAISGLPPRLRSLPRELVAAFLSRKISMDITPHALSITLAAENASGLDQFFLTGAALRLNDHVDEEIRYEHLQRVLRIVATRNDPKDAEIIGELPDRLIHQKTEHRFELYNLTRRLMVRFSASVYPHFFYKLASSLPALSEEKFRNEWISLAENYRTYVKKYEVYDLKPVAELLKQMILLQKKAHQFGVNSLYKTTHLALEHLRPEEKHAAVDSFLEAGKAIDDGAKECFFFLLLNEMHHFEESDQLSLFMKMAPNFPSIDGPKNFQNLFEYLVSKPKQRQLQEMTLMIRDARIQAEEDGLL